MSDRDGPIIVSFPTVLKTSEGIQLFGKNISFSLTEILVVFILPILGGSLLISTLGFSALAVSVVFVVLFTLYKISTPEETGLAYPRYLSKLNKTYAYETGTAQNIPKITGIEDWYLKTPWGYVGIVEVEPVNFFYSTYEEQRTYYTGFLNFLNALEFPIQIVSITAEFSVNRYLNRLAMRMKDEDIVKNEALLETLKGYTKWLVEYISAIKVRKYYVVVGVRKIEFRDAREETMLNELRKRLTSVEVGLRNAGINARILTKNEIFHVYELLFNRRVNVPANYDSTLLFMR